MQEGLVEIDNKIAHVIERISRIKWDLGVVVGANAADSVYLMCSEMIGLEKLLKEREESGFSGVRVS